jgi:hypothetical protein
MRDREPGHNLTTEAGPTPLIQRKDRKNEHNKKCKCYIYSNSPFCSILKTWGYIWPIYLYPADTRNYPSASLPAVLCSSTFLICLSLHLSWDSSVGIATGYGLDGREVGVRVLVRSKMFSSPRHPDQFWGPPSLLFNGYRGFSPGIKRPGREADHSPPTSANVKNTWIHTSTPPYAFKRSAYLVKHRDTFTFTFMMTSVVLLHSYQSYSGSFCFSSVCSWFFNSKNNCVTGLLLWQQIWSAFSKYLVWILAEVFQTCHTTTWAVHHEMPLLSNPTANFAFVSMLHSCHS